MLFTQIISHVILGISLFLTILALSFGFFKNIGATYFGFSTILLYLLISLFPYVLSQGILYTAPHAWGIAYIFIVFHAFCLIIPYCILVGTLIFGKKNIYRLNHFLIPKKYSYKDVIRYRMKYESGTFHTRFGPKKSIVYNFEIYFFDKKSSEFAVNKHNDRKVTFIKNILEEKRCRVNGKIKK